VNPLYLMIPVTVSASFSYILPVSTPPNAIVYAYGDITMIDIVCLIFLLIYCYVAVNFLHRKIMVLWPDDNGLGLGTCGLGLGNCGLGLSGIDYKWDYY